MRWKELRCGYVYERFSIQPHRNYFSCTHILLLVIKKKVQLKNTKKRHTFVANSDGFSSFGSLHNFVQMIFIRPRTRKYILGCSSRISPMEIRARITSQRQPNCWTSHVVWSRPHDASIRLWIRWVAFIPKSVKLLWNACTKGIFAPSGIAASSSSVVSSGRQCCARNVRFSWVTNTRDHPKLDYRESH